jgi:antirestriction protein ArdC
MEAKSDNYTKTDVYQKITDQIVAAIEAGAGPVEMPWHRSGVCTTRPANAFTAKPYQGVNIVSLWAATAINDLKSGYWATFKQWQCLGAHVQKGEKGSPIVFYKNYDFGNLSVRNGPQKEDSNTPDESKAVRWFARTSWVFNAEQVEGWSPPKVEVPSSAEILSQAETFIARTRAKLRHGGDSALYSARDDIIEMPAREAFMGTATSGATESYYAVLLHELTHWSGHPSRLDRQLSNRFGNKAYAMEELIAELGASFLCAECAITSEPRPDHANYIADWLDVLKKDKRAIFTAAQKASEATSFLIALQTTDDKQALTQDEGDGS